MKHINEAIIKEAKGGIEEYEGTLTPGMKVIVEVHEDSDYFKVHSFKKAKEFFNYYSFDKVAHIVPWNTIAVVSFRHPSCTRYDHSAILIQAPMEAPVATTGNCCRLCGVYYIREQQYAQHKYCYCQQCSQPKARHVFLFFTLSHSTYTPFFLPLFCCISATICFQRC